MENKIDELFNKYGIKEIYETIDKSLIKLPKGTYIRGAFAKKTAHIEMLNLNIKPLFNNKSQEELINAYSDFHKIFIYNPELKTEKNVFFINDIIKPFLELKLKSLVEELKENIKEQYDLLCL